MKRLLYLFVFSCFFLTFGGASFAQLCNVSLFVDAAPNVYGSPDYAGWESNAFALAAGNTFVNMANGINPLNVGTTDFEIQDEVVYSFGDLGKRLTWIYYIPNTTIAELTGKFKIKLENYWDGEYLDFYDYYYGSTWLEPTKWQEYNDGVIGTAGMAWWGAYNTNTQAELDADLAEWVQSEETWIFTTSLNDVECSIESYRAPIPEPGSILLLASGIIGIGFIGWFRRRKS